jgi:putative redox protein
VLEAVAADVGWVQVREAPGAGPFAQDVQLGRHTLRADEPLSYGGQDSGPSPYDLLTAALGSCTSMTLRMYAQRKGWPLTGVRTRLRHAKVHARDCASCETQEGKVDRLERELRLEGPLSDEQRQRLLEIADRCPVHRTLEGEVEVLTRLQEPS